MKKLLAMLMAFVMILGLTACVTEDDTPETKATISIPPAVINPKEQVNADFYPLETDTVLRVLFTEGGEGEIDASKLWEEVTGIELDVLTWTGEQLSASLAATDIPDAIVMPWDFPKAKVYEFGAAGKFLDFSKHLDKMPNLCALIKQYPEILEVCAYPDGGMYSLPKVGWSNTNQSNLLYIRTDIMEELGWEKAPATTDELLQFIKEAQEKYKDNPEFKAFIPQTKSYMNWNGQNTLASTLFSSFGELVETGLTLDAENKVVLGAATEQYRYYLEYMNQLWNSGAFETGIYTMDSASSKAAIQNGNCAISIGTYANTSSFADGVAHIEVMEPLVSKYQGTKQWMKNPVVNFRACVANANCEDLDTLLAFLDSFYAPHDNPLNKEGTVYGASLSKGVTGVNIAIDHEAKTWTSLEKFSNYSDNLYTGIIGEYVPISSLHVKGKGTMENLLPYAKEVSNLTALVVLSEDDQDNYADLWTDLEKYISQMHGKFITGQEDLETGWDNYLSRLNQMGLEEVLEIYQNAYDPN